MLGSTLIPAVAVADASPLTPELLAEVLSRAEMLDQMGVAPEVILRNVETEITGRAHDYIMAYGPTPQVAVPLFLRTELARRQAADALATLNREHRSLMSCLAEDPRTAGYRAAVESFLDQPRGRFDAVAAVADLSVDTHDVRECLRRLNDLYAAAQRAERSDLAKAYWCIANETKLALQMRDAELARHPLRRTLERTRDAAISVYYHIKKPFVN